MHFFLRNQQRRGCRAQKKNGFFLSFCLLLLVLAPAFLAASAVADTTMTHTAPDYFVSGERILLGAQAEDPSGVKLVRCYFKAAGEADLVFVPMNSTGKDEYAAILPAPSAATTQIEYLFLAVNTESVVVRTQTFTMTKNEAKGVPDWQEIPKEGEIKVSMELDKVPTELRGFSDNVTIDAVESGARFGVVALLYYHITDSDSSHKGASTQSGTAAGTGASASAAGSAAAVTSAEAATGATSAGIITAGTAGWSTAAIVGIGVGAAAVAGGTAVAVNAASDDDDDDDGGGGGGDVIECNTLTTAGGDDDESHSINLGQRSGTFDFSYETYGIEDRMTVSYEGTVIFDTGCVGTNGTLTRAVSYSGDSRIITVDVDANCAGATSGTAWQFTVNCPR